MRVEKELIKLLAESADLVNTINGGMSLAHVHNYKLEDHYLVTVKVPGVAKRSLKVETHDGNLFVFQLMHLEDGIEIPYMIASIPLKPNVNLNGIRANFEGKNLNIVMPIQELDDEAMDREINIDF
ncbi:MAG: Hsp20/alpha crystallin family protein [Cyclobacteriaceae bacterium]